MVTMGSLRQFVVFVSCSVSRVFIVSMQPMVVLLLVLVLASEVLVAVTSTWCTSRVYGGGTLLLRGLPHDQRTCGTSSSSTATAPAVGAMVFSGS